MKYLIVISLFISAINSQGQNIGMEISSGAYVGTARTNGALIIDIEDDDWQLNIDDATIQSTIGGFGGGFIQIQPHGGCTYLSTSGTTYANDLATDSIYWYSSDSNRYQVQTMASGQIAFGVINSDGDKSSGTDNWSSTYNTIWDRYEISISGEDYNLFNYATTVTGVGGIPVVPVVSSVDGKLLVTLYDLQGHKVENNFSFVINKYQSVSDTPSCIGEVPQQVLVEREPISLNQQNK